MNKFNTKVHLRVQDFQTICGTHKTVRSYEVSEVIEQITCGNCLRKYLVFKWSPLSRRKLIEGKFIKFQQNK